MSSARDREGDPAPPASRRRARRTVERRYVGLAEGQIHLRTIAGVEPAIVFLHQTASSSASFEPVLERLRLANRLVAVDTPGFGGSFDPRGWPSVARYAAYIVAVLDRLGIRRFHLFGHHTGGSFALEVAKRHPRRVRSLMILGPVIMSAAERREFRAQYGRPIAPRADGSHLIENWNYAHRYNPHCALEVVHSEVVNMLRAWRGRAQAYRAVSFQDDGALLRRLEVPLLLLSSREDYFFPKFDALRRAFSGASSALVGGENFPTLVDGAGVAGAIEAFVIGLRSAHRRPVSSDRLA